MVSSLVSLRYIQRTEIRVPSGQAEVITGFESFTIATMAVLTATEYLCHK